MSDQTFISYSKKDSAFANQLADDLLKTGFQVWIDRSIGGGDKWRESIETNLKESNQVVVVVSPNSMASDWVKHEGSLAYGWGKRLYPVLLEPVKGLPPWLEEFQWVSFVDVPYQKAFNALVNALMPSNPTQNLLDERVKEYKQTRELFGEEIINLVESERDRLCISTEAEEIIKTSKEAIEERKHREKSHITALHDAEHKQVVIKKRGRTAITALLISFGLILLILLLSAFPAWTGWQRMGSLDAFIQVNGNNFPYVVAVDNKNPEAVFVSDGTPGGFYKAAFHQEACWNKIEVIPNFNLEVSDITASDNHIYTIASERLFASVDGGVSWKELILPANQGALKPIAVAVNPRDAQQVFVGTDPAGLFLYKGKEGKWQRVDLPTRDGSPIDALSYNGVDLLLATGQIIWVRNGTPPTWKIVLQGIDPIYGLSMIGEGGRFLIAGGGNGILDADISLNQAQKLVDSPPSTFIQSISVTDNARYVADKDGIWYWRLWPWTDVNWFRFRLRQPIPCYQ